MRRVYFACFKNIITHQITVQAALFTLALFTFGELVHVKRIVDSLVSIPLSSLPQYVTGAVMGGEVLTLIATGTMIFIALSLPLQIRSQFAPKFRIA